MDVSNETGLCPCDSGLEFSDCCGVPGRTAFNAGIYAKITLQGLEFVSELTPQLQTAIDSIQLSPDLFPARIQFAENRVYFVKMTPQLFNESVFLDPSRMKGTCVIETDLAWLQEATEGIQLQSMPMIFHTAFCGSTLMSQALETIYDSLSLREPELPGSIVGYLRSQMATQEEKDEWFYRLMGLLSRRYEPDHPVIIKANDNANPLMIKLLERKKGAQVLFMYTPLREFLSGCLKAESRREWIRNRYHANRVAAANYLDMPEDFSVDDEAYGEMAAVYWSYNVAMFQEAWRYAPDHLRSLDFNHMLEDPMKALTACGELFKLKQRIDVDPVEEVGKVFGVYSKNSQVKYSPQKRRDDIDKILNEFPSELASAERLAKKLLGDDYPTENLPGSLLE